MKNPKINKHKLFGTDGIRGTYGVYPLTNGMLATIACSFAQSVQRQSLTTRRAKNIPTKKKILQRRLPKIPRQSVVPKIVIGKDNRLSGTDIEKILADNITKYGIDVLLLGTITTGALSFFVKDLNSDAGIMISASHNKPEDNGIKLFNSRGHKFSEQEEKKLESIIFNNLDNLSRNSSKASGRVFKIENAESRYVKFLTSTIKGLDLGRFKIALDCAWGAAAPFAKRLFVDLGAKVKSIHDKPLSHKVNQGGAINPLLLKKLVLDSKADIGIALDGDGDRGILVDEKGRVVDGDYIIAIIARYLRSKNRLAKNTVVTTVMSNYGLKESLKRIGVKIISTNVGDKYVSEVLVANNLNLGGEQSGHIIFFDYLATPDGLLTALQILQVMKQAQSPLSELCKCMTKFPQILINVKVREKKPFEQISSLNLRFQEFNRRLKDEGRILLRYSGTEDLARVMVEGRDKELIEDIANSLAFEIKQEIGAE